MKRGGGALETEAPAGDAEPAAVDSVLEEARRQERERRLAKQAATQAAKEAAAAKARGKKGKQQKASTLPPVSSHRWRGRPRALRLLGADPRAVCRPG